MIDQQNRFEEEMNLGHTAAWDLDWEEAANHYQLALAEKPDDPTGLVSLGLAQYELGYYDQSVENYLRAIELSPNDALAYDKVAQLYEMMDRHAEVISPALRASELYLRQGNLSKSIECLVRVVRVNSENLQAHSRLALIYERTGRKQQSVNEYLMVASILQHSNEYEDAMQAIERALEISPESKEAKEAHSLVSAGQILPKPISIEIEAPRIKTPERFSEEEKLSKHAVSELDPIQQTHAVAIKILAGLVIEQDSNGNESKFQVQDGAGDSKIFDHLSQAMNYWAQGSKGAAADEIELAINQGLVHPAAYYELGAVRSGEDRLESAIRYLQHAVTDPDYALASRLLIARTSRYMDKLSDAATNYLEALRLADAQLVPEDQSADMLRMYDPIIETEIKQKDPVIKNQLCDVIEDLLVQPGWQTQLSQTRGDFQIDVEGVPAIPIGEIISNPQGKKIVESVRQINQYARASFWRSAMEEAFFAIQFAPTYLPLHTYMGELLLKQDNLPEAVNKFEAIAKTYQARGESQHAAKILQRIIKAAPMDLSARTQLISLHEEMGNFDQAINEKVDLAGVYYNLADLSRAKDVYLDAYKIAQNSGASTEIKIKILYHLADVEMQSLDWKHAEEIYGQIQGLKPDDHMAIERMIEIKLRLGQDHQANDGINEYLSLLDFSEQEGDGLKYLSKLSAEYPDKLFIKEKIADLYKEAGQIESAIEAYDQIAELLFDAGERQAAIEAVEMIITLDPPNKEEYKEFINKLKSAD